MQIHVITQGQSLFSIAQLYGVTIDEIAALNELNPNDTLVIGQALVIPLLDSTYTVQAGDSLYLIARRFGTTVAELVRVNGLNPAATLPVGLQLVIPRVKQRYIESNAYIEPMGGSLSPTLEQAARNHVHALTFLAPFCYRIGWDGTLNPPVLGPLPAIARGGRATLMMVVANLTDDGFSAELGAHILRDEARSQALLDQIVAIAKEVGFYDVHFDFEHLFPEDRENYNNFLRRAAALLHAQGLSLSTALAPKTRADQPGQWYEAHDYRAHGEIVDFVIIMTYEWGYSGGPPMPVSPIGPVREVLEFAVSEIPAYKVMMGQNLYGYDWTLPFVSGGPYARALSPQQAIATARENHARILYDETAQAPHFDYWQGGKQHKVWFEDARSIDAKFALLTELGLRGISYWKLGWSFPQNWALLTDQFEVVKKY